MAYKNSGELAPTASYTLGNYELDISSAYDATRNVTSITARCGKIGAASKPFKVKLMAGEVAIKSWHVEANDTTADVYVTLLTGDPSGGTITLPIPSATTGHMVRSPGNNGHDISFTSGSGLITYSASSVGQLNWNAIFASAEEGAVATRTTYPGGNVYATPLSHSYIYNNKRVYYFVAGASASNKVISVSPSYDGDVSAVLAWMMIYGESISEDREEKLVGRFAIDLVTAGGAGAGDGYVGGWSDPADYDYYDYPDPDTRLDTDPTYTLNLTVTGALSGRHNDPLEDTSYSYTPSDNEARAGYGCGGEGGHGGGGGAGASTVIVRKFSTGRADSKDITALARRHGYGSGGGKGGKGGDGCILVYY